MNPIALNVPYADKDSAKQAASAAGGRLQWKLDERRWYFVGPKLPVALEKYRPAPAVRGTNGTAKALAPTPPPERPYVHVLDVPFEHRGFVQSFGAKWSKKHNVTVLAGDLPQELHRYASPAHSWERWQEEEINGIRHKGSPGSGNAKPREHQLAAIDLIVRRYKAGHCGTLLADDVGLGKTWTSIFAIDAIKDFKTILVVCPLSVVPAWREVIDEVGSLNRRYVVVTWDGMRRLFSAAGDDGSQIKSRKRTKRKIRTRAGVARYAKALGFDCVLFDESHRAKTPTTARAKLHSKLRDSASYVIWLSATAGQTPLELSYMVPLLAEATGAKRSELNEWEDWWQQQGFSVTKGAFGAWSWERNDEDLRRIHRILFGGKIPAGIRRTPADIRGWPEKNRILVPAELGPEEWDLYRAAWEEFREDMGMDARGRDGSNGLVKQLRFRQKASLLRIAPTVDLALSLLDNGHQVAISTEFIETLTEIQKAIEAATKRPCAIMHGKIDGGRAAAERERQLYQAGKKRVIIFTQTESISLHQLKPENPPRSQIIHDLRWSGITQHQLEGRSHRDGFFAQLYWMYAQGTIEQKLTKVVAGRVADMQAMHGDDTSAMRDIEASVQADIRKILRSEARR